MSIAYDQGKGSYRNWVIAETSFNTANIPKFESIFSLGNGYLGLRAAVEEHYKEEVRGLYLAGLFDRFPGEVTELPNLPDWIGLDIFLAGEQFNLIKGEILKYNRSLNLKDGHLIREVLWR
ncbi:MAG: glycoside hydrolase family 65 protein, partial [bacterium]